MNHLTRALIYVSLFLFPQLLQADTSSAPTIANKTARKTICLNMIVKNESAVIERCLESVLPIIDYWVIVDTGSTDGTVQIIKEFMKKKGVPGELHERPWVNFAYNRNEALKHALGKGDYLFFIDADEHLVYEPRFQLPELDKDCYYVTVQFETLKFFRLLLVNAHLEWKWQGVLHEMLTPVESRSSAQLENVINVTTLDGARSKDPQKHQKDAETLEAALKDDPLNSRYVFYVAQTYASAGNYQKALENYEKRVNMDGWADEVFWSLLRIGVLQEILNRPKEEIIKSYKRAYEHSPSRVEPLYHLASYYRRKSYYTLGYEVAKIGITIPLSKATSIMVEEWMYDYGMLFEFLICAYWTGHYEESQAISVRLLKKQNLPLHFRCEIEKYLGRTNSQLLEQACRK